MQILDFNTAKSTQMHVDLNSCFASIEQQANPFLRGKPIAVAAYDSPKGCILAASVEAKRYGIKTGMRIFEAKKLYPALITMTGDPDKYRSVHLQFRELFSHFTPTFVPKSIDDFYLDFSSQPYLELLEIGKQIKLRVKADIGDFLTVSVGIGPSRFIAKTASNFHKPDGLTRINYKNYLTIYKNMNLKDLHGINVGYETRLHSVGIKSVLDFYYSPLWKLRAAFRSVGADYWYSRLRGFEIDNVDFGRKSFGNSYALPVHNGTREELLPILQRLVEKTGSRLRAKNMHARGVVLSLNFKNYKHWQQSKKLSKTIFDSRDIYKELVNILKSCPDEVFERNKVRVLAESVFDLQPNTNLQLNLFENNIKKYNLINSVDKINNKWGDFVVSPANLLTLERKIHDRISFGGVRELG